MRLVGSVRAWGNATYVNFIDAQRRRRNRRSRTLVVALNWDGSVQQFYHFLLGFYAPLCVWILRTRRARIQVRDCGPMNPWFDTLSRHTTIEIIRPGTALRVFAGGRSRTAVLRGLDDPSRFSTRKLRQAREAMLTVLEIEPAPDPTIVITIDRATSDDFYHSRESENPMSGSERRSVPNLTEAVNGLEIPVSSRILDTAVMTPREQVQSFLGTRVLIGQHGAGLAHMVWMAPGSTVIEIHPPLPPEAVETFARLAAALGHTYIRVPQQTTHSPVECALLDAAVKTALQNL